MTLDRRQKRSLFYRYRITYNSLRSLVSKDTNIKSKQYQLSTVDTRGNPHRTSSKFVQSCSRVHVLIHVKPFRLLQPRLTITKPSAMAVSPPTLFHSLWHIYWSETLTKHIFKNLLPAPCGPVFIQFHEKSFYLYQRIYNYLHVTQPVLENTEPTPGIDVIVNFLSRRLPSPTKNYQLRWTQTQRTPMDRRSPKTQWRPRNRRQARTRRLPSPSLQWSSLCQTKPRKPWRKIGGMESADAPMTWNGAALRRWCHAWLPTSLATAQVPANCAS